MNIDYMYTVPHFVRAGETLSSISFEKNPGGKGCNQAGALAKAGCDVYMAGKVGADGVFLVDRLRSCGVDCSHVRITDKSTGHAIIQLDRNSQNSILLFPGENKNITEEEISEVLGNFGEGDWLILQNEINNLSLIIRSANLIGMRICYNPAPFDDSVLSLPLEMVDLLIVNEIEASGIAGVQGCGYDEILDELRKRFPDKELIMTVGKHGSYYQMGETRIHQDIFPCKVVDTTAAGDTFIGYYIASLIKGYDTRQALDIASKASSLAVSRKGSLDSAPYADEVF